MSIPTGPRHRISRLEARDGSAPRPDGSLGPRDDTDLERLFGLVARGDQDAFETIYDRLSGPAYGLVRKVIGCVKLPGGREPYDRAVVGGGAGCRVRVRVH